jgi:hypothetical protein
MSNEEIKKECDIAYGCIKIAEDRLKELRAICKHEKTFEGNYSYRVGSIHVCNICSYCGTPVDFIKPFILAP